MATTMYFEETILDEAKEGKPIDLEFGTMTALPNGGNLYIRVNGDTVLVERQQAQRIYNQLQNAVAWLGIET
jgi:hypothetical protein